jgi:hypothetical protein
MAASEFKTLQSSKVMAVPNPCCMELSSSTPSPLTINAKVTPGNISWDQSLSSSGNSGIGTPDLSSGQTKQQLKHVSVPVSKLKEIPMPGSNSQGQLMGGGR